MALIRRRLYNYETVKALKTKGKFRKAYDRNQDDSSKLNQMFTDKGRGHWKNEDVQRAADEGDELSIAELELRQESRVLGFWSEQWFGDPPYFV